jgi:hypothetical protein
LAFDDRGCRVRRFILFFVQPHDICAKHWRYFDCLDLRRFELRVPFLNYSFDRNIVILWCHARSVVFDTVLPSLLSLDIIWLLRPQEGFSGPEIFFEVFLADVDAVLVENFDHVVVRSWGFGVVVRVIPGKWMNQYMNQNFRKLNFEEFPLTKIRNFEGSLTSDPASDIAGNRRAVVASRNMNYPP